MQYFPRHIITTLVLAYFIAIVLSRNSFLIYFFFLPASICVLTLFLFFLFSLLCYPSNICLLKQFPLSVFWAEPLKSSVHFSIWGKERNSLYYLEHINLLKISREHSPQKLCVFICVSPNSLRHPPFFKFFFFVKLYIWVSHKQYPEQNNAPDVCFLPSSYANNRGPFAIQGQCLQSQVFQWVFRYLNAFPRSLKMPDTEGCL